MTVDPDGPIDDVDVTGFDGLLAVVERGGTYVGRVTLAADRLARDGRIAGETIRREVRTALWAELWTAALRDRLHRRIGSQWWEHVPHASVTVAVCTRDRPAQVARCLEALARLDPPPDRILIVDNAPDSRVVQPSRRMASTTCTSLDRASTTRATVRSSSARPS